ncbi:hypothetical protein SLA2020_380460 [Shorea laevis]
MRRSYLRKATRSLANRWRIEPCLSEGDTPPPRIHKARGLYFNPPVFLYGWAAGALGFVGVIGRRTLRLPLPQQGITKQANNRQKEEGP